MSIAYIGLGSNMGDKIANIRQAVEEINKTDEIKVLGVSSLYRTEPVGKEDQDWFVNAVIKVDTILTPKALLDALLHIETGMGRIREAKWGPRTIDLDILLYDDIVTEADGLVIPHSLLHERRFVLTPLSELSPGLEHPLYKKKISAFLSELADDKKIERIGG